MPVKSTSDIVFFSCMNLCLKEQLLLFVFDKNMYKDIPLNVN